MTYIIQASVGRNIGQTPMSARDWSRFLNDVSDAIRLQGESPEIHIGQGTWDGVSEESAHLTFYRESNPLADWNASSATRERLRTLAEHYGQDAIGFTVCVSAPILARKASTLDYSGADPELARILSESNI